MNDEGMKVLWIKSLGLGFSRYNTHHFILMGLMSQNINMCLTRNPCLELPSLGSQHHGTSDMMMNHIKGNHSPVHLGDSL